jgi:tetratricopeptide (TPR) repeat protein
MSEERYPYIVKRWHACAHQKIPIIFTKKRGVRFDKGLVYIGYPKEPFQERGILSEECRQFLIELQVRGKLHPLIVFGPHDSIFIEPHTYPAAIKEYHGTNYITSRAFLNGKEGIIVDDYILDGHHAAVIIKRTHYGAYLLFLRYKDTNEEQWIQQGSLSSVVEASNKMLGRYDRADEEKPIYRLDRGTLTIDRYPVLKIFGTDSGKRWFVTWCEEVQDVSSSESSPGEEIRVYHQQFFGVIRDSDQESWEFWMDEEIKPGIRSGEVREYKPDELNFFDVSTFDQVYQEGADPVDTVASPTPSPVAGKPDNQPLKKISKRKQKKVQRNRSGSQKKGEVDERIAAYEAKIKSLVDEGKYKEAIEYSDEHGSVLYESDVDSCTLYSYKIIGVCRAKNIRKAWSEGGYQPPYWIEAGNTFFDAGNYQQAIGAYYKRIDEDREDDRAWYLMGCVYRAMGNPYESVEAWEKAFSIVQSDANLEKLESNSDNAPAWAERGDIDYDQGNWRAAIDSYRNALSVDLNQPEIWFRKGCCHYEIGEFEEALVTFRETVKLDSRHFSALNDIGVIHCRSGRNAEGAKQFQAALSMIPDESFETSLIQSNLERAKNQPDGIPLKNLTFLS